MNSENPIVPKRRFKNGVFAALDLCAEKRAQESGLNEFADGRTGQRYVVERAAAIIEAEVARLNANDFTALEALCASHVLALDAIFNHAARESARSKTLSNPSIGLALRAQSQCRMTLKTLASLLGTPTCPPKLEERRWKPNSDEGRMLGEGGAAPKRSEGGLTAPRDRRKNREISPNKLLNVEISTHDQ
jgi:hypothetical protein